MERRQLQLARPKEQEWANEQHRLRRWGFVVILNAIVAIAGAILLVNAGMIADADNLESNFHPVLWAILGLGVLGILVSVPAWLAQRKIARHRVSGEGRPLHWRKRT